MTTGPRQSTADQPMLPPWFPATDDVYHQVEERVRKGSRHRLSDPSYMPPIKPYADE